MPCIPDAEHIVYFHTLRTTYFWHLFLVSYLLCTFIYAIMLCNYAMQSCCAIMLCSHAMQSCYAVMLISLSISSASVSNVISRASIFPSMTSGFFANLCWYEALISLINVSLGITLLTATTAASIGELGKFFPSVFTEMCLASTV